VGEQSQYGKREVVKSSGPPKGASQKSPAMHKDLKHTYFMWKKIKKKSEEKIRQQSKALVRLTAFADCVVLLLVAASTSSAAASADRVASAGLFFAAADLVLAAAVDAAAAADLVLAAAVDAAAAADLVLTAAAAGALDRVASAADL
jgi:hypothetical protein